MKDFKLPDFDHYSQLFEFSATDIAESETKAKEKYTKKITGLVYEPKGEQPGLSDCLSEEKTDRLIEKILASGVTDSEKSFLLKAAFRHYVFNYENIAEYYCHSTKEMQELMEESALVIIDFNSAIEGGYVEFSDKMKDIWWETWGKESKDDNAK
jgi:hypothetical protein